MRQITIAAVAAMIGFGFIASPAQAVTYNITLQDTVPTGISGVGTLTFASALQANHTYVPGAEVTLLDFVINSVDFNVTSSFIDIATNSTPSVISIIVADFAIPGNTLTTGSLAFQYSGPNGVFGNGNIVIGAGTSPTPLPAALPLFASGLGVVGLLARRRKRKPVLAA